METSPNPTEQLRQLALGVRAMRLTVENSVYGVEKNGLPPEANPALLAEMRRDFETLVGQLPLLQDQINKVQDKQEK